jgi:hypothetical protein
MGSFNAKDSGVIIWNNTVYTYDKIDRVIGGIDGTSNKPVIDLSQNAHYLKKFKGTLLRDSGDPNSSSTVSTFLSEVEPDEFLDERLMYLDDSSGDIWTITGYDGSTVGSITWQNQYQTKALNIKQLNINGDGDQSTYVYFEYDPINELLKLKDDQGDLADLQVDNLKFNIYNGADTNVTNIQDNEVLLLSQITDPSQNTDAFCAVKRLEETGLTITGYESNIDGGQTGESDNFDKWYIDGDLPGDLEAGDYIQIDGLEENSNESINGYYRVSTFNDESQTGTNEITTDRTFNALEADIDQPTLQTGNSGSIYKDNSAILKWENNYDNGTGENTGRFVLIDREDNLLPLKVGSLQIGEENASFYGLFMNTLISSEAQFENINWSDRSNEWIYVDVDNLTLTEDILINGNNLKLEFKPGCTIDMNGYIIDISGNTNVTIKGGIWTNTGTGVDTIIDMGDCINCRLENMIFENCIANTCIIGDTLMENCVINNIKIDDSNNFNILINDIYNSNVMECWLDSPGTGTEVVNIYNSNFVGFIDGEPEIYNTESDQTGE